MYLGPCAKFSKYLLTNGNVVSRQITKQTNFHAGYMDHFKFMFLKSPIQSFIVVILYYANCESIPVMSIYAFTILISLNVYAFILVSLGNITLCNLFMSYKLYTSTTLYNLYLFFFIVFQCFTDRIISSTFLTALGHRVIGDRSVRFFLSS